MIKVNLHSRYESFIINAMIDSGATEYFIDHRICDMHQITTYFAVRPQEIYLIDGKLGVISSLTHMAEVLMQISGHRELATLQVTNLQNHKIILGMLWLKGHNPKMN